VDGDREATADGVRVSLIGRAVVFALREIARPTFERVGEHVGNAVGNVIGRRIDPKHGQTPDVDDKDEKDT
jgi:hypothetical protein